jgi:hypothetical protein
MLGSRMLLGAVVSRDRKTNTGIIRDQVGREFFVFGYECEGGQIPPKYTTVTFYKDADYRTNVACMVDVQSYPSTI